MNETVPLEKIVAQFHLVPAIAASMLVLWSKAAEAAGKATWHGRRNMDAQRFLITLGLVMMAVGLLWPRLSKLGFDLLPGDIVIEGVNMRILMPITISLLTSILISLVLWLIKR